MSFQDTTASPDKPEGYVDLPEEKEEIYSIFPEDHIIFVNE